MLYTVAKYYFIYSLKPVWAKYRKGAILTSGKSVVSVVWCLFAQHTPLKANATR